MKRRIGDSRHEKKRELLTAILTLCYLDPTMNSEILRDLFASSRRIAELKMRVLKPGRASSVNLDALGHVVYRWQRTPKYLDDEGRPLKLPERGRKLSIEALFRETGHSDYFESGIRHLQDVGRVKKLRDGCYVACAEVSIVPRLSPELVELLAQTMNRVVATVLHNTSLKNKKSIRLIERVTMVPDLPQREVLSFKRFAREQGGALIDTMNDWLERRRGTEVRRRVGDTNRLTAGLHVFAFVERNK